MDAPLYPPASHYVQPVPAPYDFGVATISVAELTAWPAAWAIVQKHMPMVSMMVGAEEFKPNAGNMTLPDLRTFVGPGMEQQLGEIDAELRKLPAGDRPRP